MKFVLTDSYTYNWPVTVQIPDPKKPGKFAEQKFEMKFEALPREEAQSLDDEFRKLKTVREQEAQQNDVLMRVCVGWNEDVVDVDDTPLPFSEKALEAALRFSWFRVGVYRAYAESLSGDGARLKN